MKLGRAVAASDRSTVSVVIPCYRYGHYLPAVVQSVLEQPDIAPEVIIVDDASPDGSATVAAELADGDPRIRVLAHEQNKGHIQTYNDGLAMAEGEFVTLLSADDLLPAGALGRAVALMRAHPSVGLVYGLPEAFSGDVPVFRERRTTWTVLDGHRWIQLACLRGRNFILSPEVVMRTAALRSVGDYNAALPHSADLEFWLRTAARWDVGRVNGPIQAWYRVHDANMHLTTFATMPVDLQHRLEAFDVLDTDDVSTRVPRAKQWRARAHRALARESLILARRELNAGGEPDTASALLEFAHRTAPSSIESARSRAVARRLDRAVRGNGPARSQTLEEAARIQLDRVRWKVGNAVGVS